MPRIVVPHKLIPLRVLLLLYHHLHDLMFIKRLLGTILNFLKGLEVVVKWVIGLHHLLFSNAMIIAHG